MTAEFPITDVPPPAPTVEVQLVGGPDGVHGRRTAGAQAVAEGRIKIPRGNGYEHFELVPDSHGARATFRWCMRT